MFWFVDTAPGAEKYVSWGVEYKKITPNNGEAFDFGSGTSLAYTQTVVDPDTDKAQTRTTITLTSTGWEAGDMLLLRLFRDASGTGGTDDFADDARANEFKINEERAITDNIS